MKRYRDIIKDGEQIEVFCDESELLEYIKLGYEECEVPSRISVCPKGEISQRDAVMKGFYAVEQQMGTSNMIRGVGLGLSADGIKRVWERP
jgi:hypothetical protein